MVTPTGAENQSHTADGSRLFILDGLRLCAALMVLGWHLIAGKAYKAWEAPPQDLFGPLWDMSRYGWLGVELFFLISGFVICMSSWGRTVSDFAISRVVRLFPAYWAAVILTTAVIAAFPLYKQPLSTVDTLANLTMVQRFANVGNVDNSYWTLLIELIFYVLFAFVVASGLTYQRVVLFCVVWTAVALVAASFDNDQLTLIFASRYAPYFVAGVAFYLIRRFSPSLLLWGIVGLSWVLAMVRLKTEISSYPVGFRGAALIVTFFFVLMAAIAVGRLDWVRWRWLVTAGILTYPLYLLHQVIGLTIIKAVHPYLPSWLLLGGLVVAFLALAWLMHLLVERPVARLLKRHLRRSVEQIRATADHGGRTGRGRAQPLPTPAAQYQPRDIVTGGARDAAEPDTPAVSILSSSKS